MLKILWIIMATLLAASLLRTIWFSYRSQSDLKQKESQVLQLEQETQKLESQVQQATSSFTLEKRVREELQLHRNGESIIRIEP